MTTGFTTERQDPDLQGVSATLLRAGERARQLARQTSTGISVQPELLHAPAANVTARN